MKLKTIPYKALAKASRLSAAFHKQSMEQTCHLAVSRLRRHPNRRPAAHSLGCESSRNGSRASGCTELSPAPGGRADGVGWHMAGPEHRRRLEIDFPKAQGLKARPLPTLDAQQFLRHGDTVGAFLSRCAWVTGHQCPS